MKQRSGIGAMAACLLAAAAAHGAGAGAERDPTSEETHTGCWTDRDCDDGQLCRVHDETCVDCLEDEDCASSQACVKGSCEELDASGGAGTGEPTPEPMQLCEPGSKSCEGPDVKLCNAAGTRLTSQETCGLTQVCRSGECRDIECVPNRQLCRDGEIWTCGLDGISASLVKRCQDDQFCLEDDGDARCSATACTPGDAMCSGSFATRCKTDGSGPAVGGQDCSESGELCYQGQCRDHACTLGEKLCDHGDVYLCAEGGSAIALFSECSADEACDASIGACRPRICEPGQHTCDDSRVLECNELGSGWELVEDCPVDGARCVGGACVPQVCVPSSHACFGNNGFECDALGVQYNLRVQCNTDQHCDVSYGQAQCLLNSCVPGEQVCSNAALSSCKGDGSGPEPDGTPCGPGKVCALDNKACMDQVCEPSSYFCKEGDAYYCTSDGRFAFRNYDCGSGTYCGLKGGVSLCLPYDCAPGQPACLGNQVGECAESGLALASVTQDCSKSGQVCTLALACADSTLDALGESEELQGYGSAYVVGDTVDVLSTRKLSQLEVKLSLGGTRDLRFVVYEKVGDYDLIAKYDKLVSGQSGSGYFSSGALEYTLEAGHRYLLGVVSDSGTVAAHYDSAPWSPSISFGRVVGGIATYGAPTIYEGATDKARIYALRITTTP
jgi:hypothetical protein